MLFLSLILLQIIVFAALALFLRSMMTRNLSNATTHLTELNADYVQKMEEAKKRVQEGDKYYDDTLLKAKTDAEKLRTQILKDAQISQEEMINQSRKQSGEIIEQANQARDALLKELDDKINQSALVKACELVQEILPSEIAREMHDKWFKELSKNGLDGLKRLNLSQNLKAVEIVSPYALSAEQRTLLHKKIKEEVGHEIELTEKTDPLLIAGVKMSLGSIVVDGSLKFRIQESIRHARSSA